MRGRPVKPTEIKQMQGTLRKHREIDNAIKPTIALTLTEPSELNEWGKLLWVSICEEYLKIGLITKVDTGSLLALCNEYGTYCESDDIVKAKGLEVEEEIYSQKGELVGVKTIANPMLKVRNDALKNYIKLATEFGLTPASRTRIAKPESKPDNPFGEFA